MEKPNTQPEVKKLPEQALEILRESPRSFKRVANRTGKSKALVSMVAAGQRHNEIVIRALVREAIRLAKLQGYRKAIEIEEAVGR